MTESCERPDDPLSYPRGGTYADLLHWHLYIWGTRPEGKRADGELWTPGSFLFALYGAGGSGDSPVRKLNYWEGDNDGSPPNPSTNENITKVLFGADPVFESWRIDLRLARDWSSKYNNRRTAKTSLDLAATRENVALIIDRLTEHFYGRADELAEIDKFVAEPSTNPNKLLVVTAPPGTGKSALAAQWCKINAKKPKLHVVKHFCSPLSGATTTSPENIYAHIEQQLREVYKEKKNSPTGRLDSLVNILKKPVPNNGKLVIWLDGIDQALAQVECFLPADLGKGVRIIISACADDDSIPECLRPWLTDAMAEFHKPERYHLQKLSRTDIAEMVLELLKAKGVTGVPDISAIETEEMRRFRSLIKSVHQYFDAGNALFAQQMADAAIDYFTLGKGFRYATPPGAPAGYIQTELRRLEKLKCWPDFLPIFMILVDCDEAISIDDLATITGKTVFPSSIPDPVLRWLTLTSFDDSQASPLLSFEHFLLQEPFKKAIAYQKRSVWRGIYDNLIAKPFTTWPRYALEYLPKNLINAGLGSIASELLNNPDFLIARYRCLGEPKFVGAIMGDWRGLLPADFPDEEIYASAHDHLDPVFNIRFWSSGHIKTLIDILAARASGPQD